MNSKKEFLKFIFSDESEKKGLKSQILYQFSQIDQEKKLVKYSNQQI